MLDVVGLPHHDAVAPLGLAPHLASQVLPRGRRAAGGGCAGLGPVDDDAFRFMPRMCRLDVCTTTPPWSPVEYTLLGRVCGRPSRGSRPGRPESSHRAGRVDGGLDRLVLTGLPLEGADQQTWPAPTPGRRGRRRTPRPHRPGRSRPLPAITTTTDDHHALARPNPSASSLPPCLPHAGVHLHGAAPRQATPRLAGETPDLRRLLLARGGSRPGRGRVLGHAGAPSGRHLLHARRPPRPRCDRCWSTTAARRRRRGLPRRRPVSSRMAAEEVMAWITTGPRARARNSRWLQPRSRPKRAWTALV